MSACVTAIADVGAAAGTLPPPINSTRAAAADKLRSARRLSNFCLNVVPLLLLSLSQFNLSAKVLLVLLFSICQLLGSVVPLALSVTFCA